MRSVTAQLATWTGVRVGAAAADCAFVALVSLLSAALYVGGLGFYTDDWIFLATFRAAPDQSYWGLVRFFADANMLVRPVQLLYLTGLYRLFGLAPLGYHLVNSAVLAAAAAMLLVALRELGLPRPLALAVALVYALLPHASTNRVWYSLSQTNLSALFFFVALYADLRLLRAARGAWRWHALGLAALLLSALAYELFVPMFALTPAAVWRRRRALQESRPGIHEGHEGHHVGAPSSRWLPLALLARNLAALAVVMGYKALVTDRNDGALADPLGQLVWFAGLIGQVFASIIAGPYGARLPKLWWRLLTEYRDPAALALSLAAGALVFVALHRALGRQPLSPSRRAWAAMAAVGAALCAAGYAIFLTNRQVDVTTTGINNRGAGAALLGIAVLAVAAIGLLSSFVRGERVQRALFCGLIACYCATGFLANATIGAFWVAASHEQHAVMADVRRAFPALAPGSHVFLDGMCPYIGPGIIFQAEWDFTGALRITYDDPTLRGDVVNHKLKIRPEGIYTELYHNDVVFHPYDALWFYHRGRDVVVRIPDADAARRYFAAYNPTLDSGCRRVPPGRGYPVW